MAAAVLLVLVLGTTADATTRIVPLGDSLTKGMLDTDDGQMHPTYRYPLWNKLRSNGYDVDFVGSWSVPDFPVSFDKANEGHGGYTIKGIVDGVGTGGKLSTWLTGYNPDIALVLIGTNDVLANRPMDDRFSDLGRLVDTLRAKNSRIKIFVGKLPPTGDSYRNTNSGLIAFNSRLDSWRSGKTTSTSPITVVDLYSGYDGRADNQAPRYIHPDASGEQKIADKWYAAIIGSLSKGTPVTTVPTPTVDPYAITGPMTITKPGTYYFANDIVNRNDAVCIEVKSDGVTIDGRGRRLAGTGTSETNVGIFVNGIPDVTVKNLKVSGWGYGIYYIDPGVGLGRIEGCTIENNLYAGIVLYRGVTGVSVVGNQITGHARRGIWINDAHGNVVFNNRFSNAGENVEVVGASTRNNFSVAKRAGQTNIIGGPSIGGNYWGKPAGNGFSQTHGDGNSDGFSDEAFSFSGQTDALPLTSLKLTPTPGPYRTLVVPGTIQAEDYDNGGEGVAYHDTVAGNQGGAYRSDDVDIESIDGGYALAYIRDGEWTRYTVTVQQAGDYRVTLRAAAWNGPRTVRILAGSTEIGSITVPVTGSTTTAFATATTTVRLGAGTQTLRLAYTGDSMNLDRVETALVTPTASPTPTPTPVNVPVAPFPTAHLLPALIQAEHFDAGGEGAAYHDYEPANLGNDQASRPGEGVDIETGGGVTDVCYIRGGEHLNYSVDASAGGSHVLVLRTANPDAVAKAVKVYLDGVPASQVSISPTGGWTTYSNFTASAPLSIFAGRHVVTLAFEGVDRLNLDWLDLATAAPSPTANATETVTPTPEVNETAVTTPTPNATPPTPTIAPVPDGDGLPTDTNGDGKYDDVNGNGRADFADVVLYFNQMIWIAANEPLAAFDFNGNGRVDFGDVTWLSNAL